MRIEKIPQRSVSVDEGKRFSLPETGPSVVAQKARQCREDSFVYVPPINRKPVPQKVDKGVHLSLGLFPPLLERLFSQQLPNIHSQARMFPPPGMEFGHALHHVFTVQLSRGQRPLWLKMGFRYILDQQVRFPRLGSVHGIVAADRSWSAHRVDDGSVKVHLIF